MKNIIENKEKDELTLIKELILQTKEYGLSDFVKQINEQAIKIAKEAGKDNGKNKYREMERKLSG